MRARIPDDLGSLVEAPDRANDEVVVGSVREGPVTASSRDGASPYAQSSRDSSPSVRAWLSQRQISASTGVSKGALSEYLRRAPRPG